MEWADEPNEAFFKSEFALQVTGSKKSFAVIQGKCRRHLLTAAVAKRFGQEEISFYDSDTTIMCRATGKFSTSTWRQKEQIDVGSCELLRKYGQAGVSRLSWEGDC